MERIGDTVIARHHDRENRPAWLPLMTAIIAVNLMTQPLLWAIASSFNGYLAAAISWPIILLEIGVWLIEAILLRIIQWRQLTWSDTLLLSFLMNLASFVIGLLLIL